MKSASITRPARYNAVSITLHWLTVILMFGAAFLVPEEGGSRGSSPIDIHMILGVLLAVVLIVRLIVRFSTKRPAWVSAGNDFLDKVGELTHWGLYFFAFVILAGGAAIAYQRNLLGVLTGSGSVVEQGFRGGGFFIGAFHSLGWFLAVLLILLHVGAALYHQFILKDNLFGRMWYGK